MRNTMRTACLMVPPCLFSLAACFSLGRDTPALEQYVLGRTPMAEVESGSPDRAGLTIGLRRLDLAPYLATPAIVVRRESQILVSEFHRWAEDPGEGINRAVAGYLAGGGSIGTVDVAPWPVRSRHDYLIQLHVSRFEGVEASATVGEAHLAASWEILRQQDGAVVARGATDFRERGWRVGDYAGLVTLLDRGLIALARDVVTCLESMSSAIPPASGDVEPMAPRGPALSCAPQTDGRPA